MVPSVLSRHLQSQAHLAFYGPAWHGPSLWPTLKKLKVGEAMTPSPFEGYTGWGVALHAAYWKYRALSLLAKASEGQVPPAGKMFRGPADWPALPPYPDAKAWREDVARIEQVHDRWRTALEVFPTELWSHSVRSDGLTAAELASGVASHDIYHAAMIRNMGVKKF